MLYFRGHRPAQLRNRLDKGHRAVEKRHRKSAMGLNCYTIVIVPKCRTASETVYIHCRPLSKKEIP